MITNRRPEPPPPPPKTDRQKAMRGEPELTADEKEAVMAQAGVAYCAKHNVGHLSVVPCPVCDLERAHQGMELLRALCHRIARADHPNRREELAEQADRIAAEHGGEE